MGSEGRVLKRGIYKGKGIAVLTSGGDSQVSVSFIKIKDLLSLKDFIKII